jgi:hypothetical protein
MVALVGALMMGFLWYPHYAFAAEFGVRIPWHMSQDQRNTIQPQVTRILWYDNHELLIWKNSKCKPNDGDCLQKKREGAEGWRVGLREAMGEAEYFGFDTTIVELCSDGTFPAYGEPSESQCRDGSMPSY